MPIVIPCSFAFSAKRTESNLTCHVDAIPAPLQGWKGMRMDATNPLSRRSWFSPFQGASPCTANAVPNSVWHGFAALRTILRRRIPRLWKGKPKDSDEY